VQASWTGSEVLKEVISKIRQPLHLKAFGLSTYFSQLPSCTFELSATAISAMPISAAFVWIHLQQSVFIQPRIYVDKRA